MWPDSPYAPSRGSFERPVPPPLHDPTAAPTKTFTISCEWLPYIRGALQQLLLQATWNTTDPATLLVTQQRAFQLIDIFTECSVGYPFACPYYLPSSAYAWHQQDITPYGFNNDGVYSSGNGWIQSLVYSGSGWQSGCHIQLDFASSVTLTHMEMSYDLTKGSFSAGNVMDNYIGMKQGAAVSELNHLRSFTDPDGTAKTLSWTGSYTGVTNVIAGIMASYQIAPVFPGSCRIYYIEIEGTGPHPC